MKQYTEREIEQILGRDMEVSEQANRKLREVYHRIRQEAGSESSASKEKPVRRFRPLTYVGGAAAAVACVFALSNPVIADRIPILGNIFSLVSDKAPFPGDYQEVATPLSSDEEENESYTQSSDGLTMTLSEVYCTPVGLYLTTELTVEDGFPDTLVDASGNQELQLIGTADYSYNPEQQPVMTYINGTFQDEQTYIGIFRIILEETTTDYTEYSRAVDALTEEEQNALTDGDNPYEDLIQTVEIPDAFQVHLSIEEINGMMADYESSESTYQFTGPYNFDLDVTVDREQVITVQVDDSEDAGTSYHVSSVTRTPFELQITEENLDDPFYLEDNCILLVLDGDGKRLEWGNSSGSLLSEYQIEGRNLSKIDLYLISWDTYESTGIKGNEVYYESEVDDSGVTIKELLEKHAKYHREVILE